MFIKRGNPEKITAIIEANELSNEQKKTAEVLAASEDMVNITFESDPTSSEDQVKGNK